MPTPWPSRYALNAPGQSPDTARFTLSVRLPTVATSLSSAWPTCWLWAERPSIVKIGAPDTVTPWRMRSFGLMAAGERSSLVVGKLCDRWVGRSAGGSASATRSRPGAALWNAASAASAARSTRNAM